MHVSMGGPSQKFQKDGVDFIGLFKVRDMATIFKGMKFDLRDGLSQFIAVVERYGRRNPREYFWPNCRSQLSQEWFRREPAGLPASGFGRRGEALPPRGRS